MIEKLRENIKKFNQNALEEYKFTVKNQIFKEDDNLFSRFQKIWEEIVQNTLEFDRKFKLIQELENITVKDVISTFDNIFIYYPKKLSLQFFSGNSTMNNSQLHSTGDYYLNKTIKYKVFNDTNYFRKIKANLLGIYNKTTVQNNIVFRKNVKINRRFK